MFSKKRKKKRDTCSINVINVFTYSIMSCHSSPAPFIIKGCPNNKVDQQNIGTYSPKKTKHRNMGSIHISNIKISSVVPATVTSENKAHELTNMDLVMKLHYIHGVYFFSGEAVQGLTIHDLKEPMFPCLDLYLTTSGRVRRSETGRPFIKCNDSGVRIVEAKCDKTIEEFLAMKDHPFHANLAYNQALGPDLSISPLVFIQVLAFFHFLFFYFF